MRSSECSKAASLTADVRIMKKIRQFQYYGYVTWFLLVAMSIPIAYFRCSVVFNTAFIVLCLSLPTAILAILSQKTFQRILGGVALPFILISLGDFAVGISIK